MTALEKIARNYTINVRQPADPADGYHVLYAPRALQQSRGNGDIPPSVPAPLEAIVQLHGEEVAFRWVIVPQHSESTKAEFEQDALCRVRLLHDWLGRLTALVTAVETWMRELDWATRRIETPMEDFQIGKYKAPSLLMQEGRDRILLEPISRSAPGTEGVVDLYMMPAYDDIASLYYYDDRWNLHYLVPGSVGAPSTRQAPAKPLSKATLQEVLAEMRQHAA